MSSLPLTVRAMLVATLLAFAPAAAATNDTLGPPPSEFLCYAGRSAERGSSGVERPRAMSVQDRFGSHRLDVVRTIGICDPADTNDSGVDYPLTFFQEFGVRPTRGSGRPPKLPAQTFEVFTHAGTLTFQVSRPGALLVASESPAPGYPWPYVTDLDAHDLHCFEGSEIGRSTATAPTRVPAVHRNGAHMLDVRGATRLCLPASVEEDDPNAPLLRHGLLCRRAKVARTQPAQTAAAPFTAPIRNRFGEEAVRAHRVVELCQSAFIGLPANPCPASPTPAPTMTATPVPTPDRSTLQSLTLSPSEIVREVGETKRFFATGIFPGGITLDLSNEVTFASSDPAVALAPNDPAVPNRVQLVGRGTTVISVTDPVTGVRSTDSGGDAILHASGPLEHIFVRGRMPHRQPCESDQYTATGTYEGGFSRNITQDVEWSTTAPEVATAPNAPGDRSRVIALRPGRTGIVARDPKTGITSECCPALTSDCCPTMEVVGALERIVIVPNRIYYPFSPVRAPDPRDVQVIGVYAGNGDRDVTDEVTLISSNPSAVAVPNERGRRGVLSAIGSGTAQIHAVHGPTGLVSTPITLRSLAGLTRVEIPFPTEVRGPVVGIGGFGAFLDAIGHFGDGPYPLDADEVLFTSSPPQVAEARRSGRHHYAIGLAPGLATFTATDLRTGISSSGADDLVVGVAGQLLRIRLEPATVRVLVGQERDFTAVAEYEAGVTDLVTRDLAYTLGDPAVAELTYYPSASRIHALAPGTTTLSGRFGWADTGPQSDVATITVLKPLATLAVTPPAEVRAPGRSYFYTAVGHDLDGVDINLTQDVVWSSSNPLVAAATNPQNERSRIDMVGAGAATITATEPLSGKTASTTVQVIGTLQSLVVTSLRTSFTAGEEWQLTALGVDGPGNSANITQEVTYASSNPAVVAVTNEDGNRSRIHALAPGTATLSAVDPLSGLSSSATGGNLLITVTAP